MTHETYQLLYNNNKLLTVRVNEDLFNAFKVACEAQGVSISMSIREFMIGCIMANQVAQKGLSDDNIKDYFDDMAKLIVENRE